MISALFSSVSIIIVAGYMPQIMKLLLSETRCEDISIPAWFLWFYAAAVSLLYSIYELSDAKMVIMNCANTLCISVIIMTTLYKRHKYKNTPNT